MWRIIKLQLRILLFSIFGFFTLPFLPVNLDFDPIAYNVSLPEFKGALAPNKLLDSGKIMFQQILHGPESLAVKDGLIYTGTRLGDVYAIDPVRETLTKVANTGSECGGFHDEEKCGRVLGLRFAKNGDLYGIDAFKGLLKIDIKTGKVETLVKAESYVGSSRLRFGDDLDIDDDGIIYYSQGSRRWGLHQIIYIVMEYDTTGRILTYDTKTKKSGVLIDGIAFPNGVQLTADKKALLYSELNAKRINRYELQGPSKGKVSVFADRLPGGPDNLRLSPRGTYWVAYDTARSASTPYVADLIAPYPLIAKATMRFCWLSGQALKYVYQYFDHPTIRDFIADLEHGKILLSFAPKRGIITELDQNGKILRSMHSSHLSMFSEVLEFENHFYIGSFINPYLLRIGSPKN
ncbi:adipocyte plasma membrane-associated protein [Galendromus occidentalis]|uniref:Adipocyte plasma membrane-associated protein n=1 Tax=Galendromus occidentalis TaxID=34638 RepID=A0AAJ7SIJ2_9ACAR|nr:adipocyte plasma membrane-associated protein [Galendromus occidentalis]